MPQLLLLGAVIGANNFAAALALGALGQKPRRWRVAPIFGAVEFVVPLIGLAFGRSLAGGVGELGRAIAPALLAALGFWMLYGALRKDVREEEWAARAATVGGALALALGLSLDNLVVGFSFGLDGRTPLTLAAVIGASSMLFTFVGMTVGGRARRRMETQAEIGAALLVLVVAAAAALGWL